MDERLPLENRSLTHTSKEPEGQAWAQIGTNVPKAKSVPESPTKTATPSKPKESAAASEKPAAPSTDQDAAGSLPEAQTEKDEDALSEDRELQVVEDADPERFTLDESMEEKEEGKETAAAGEDGGKERGCEGNGVGETQEKEPKEKEKKGSDTDESKARTNSNNPWMIRSRVFVGHLNTEKCSRKEIEELFAPYGNVIGCSLQHGYGFVQYDEEESAKRAIRELHGLHFKGMKLVVDKTAALKKMLGENPNAPKPWHSERGERHRFEEMEYLRRREFYDRYARLEELERMYYDRYPPPPSRDPYYDRFVDRYPNPPPRDPYFDRYRYPEMERGRYYDRYPPTGGPPGGYDRPYYDRPYDHHHPDHGYDRPRDDPYDRREREKESLRDREPFERFETSRRL